MLNAFSENPKMSFKFIFILENPNTTYIVVNLQFIFGKSGNEHLMTLNLLRSVKYVFGKSEHTINDACIVAASLQTNC